MKAKQAKVVLRLLLLGMLLQGGAPMACLPGSGGMEYSRVTITIDDQPRTLHFASLRYHDDAKHLRTVLEKLAQGKPVAIDAPDRYGEPPLYMAVEYALGRRYGDSDPDFYATRYLLIHGADVNKKFRPFEGKERTAVDSLCSSLYSQPEVGVRGLVLLLSYGAKLATQVRDARTTITILEELQPWIPKAMRVLYASKQEDASYRPKTTEQPLVPEAWEAHIPPATQRLLKSVYWTYVAQALLQAQQHCPLDPAFVAYVENAGVEARLVQQLRNRTRAPASSSS